MESHHTPPGGRRYVSRRNWAPQGADPTHAVEAFGDVAALVHDLSNLLDGSLRWIAVASRTLESARAGDHPHAPTPEPLAQLAEQLQTVRSSLERMTDLVHASLQGTSLPLGSPLLAKCSPISLVEACEHAARVIAPRAEEAGVAIVLDVHSSLRDRPAGSLYTVILNGLQNALESVLSLPTKGSHDPGARSAGRIELRGRVDHSDAVVIDIIDDGAGLSPEIPAGQVFDAGFSTKHNGLGIGLSMARSLVAAAGGTVELKPRADRADQRRPGAILTIRVPPAQRTHT